MTAQDIANLPLDGSMEEVGNICERALMSDQGETDFSFIGSPGGPSRKQFCQFLGIGESTLTGWMQAKRIPRAAAIALVSYWNLKERAGTIKRLVKEKAHPRVIAMDGKYAVCEFGKGEDGEPEGRIIAQGIPDYGIARAMARSRSVEFHKLLKSAANRLHEYYEIEPSQLDYVHELKHDLDRDYQLATDYAAWLQERRAPPTDIRKLPF